MKKNTDWPRLADLSARSIDYRLNILGIRVWEDGCQLVALRGEGWVTIGPRFALPREMTRKDEGDTPDALTATVLQYAIAWPGSDLQDVLAKRKDFTRALTEAAARQS